MSSTARWELRDGNLPKDKHHTMVLNLVRRFRTHQTYTLQGNVARHPWAAMNAACAVSGPANVEPMLIGGIMNEQFLVFRAKVDITAYSGELLWSYSMRQELGALQGKEAAGALALTAVKAESPHGEELRKVQDDKAENQAEEAEDMDDHDEEEAPELAKVGQEAAAKKKSSTEANLPAAKRARTVATAPEISDAMLVAINEATPVAKVGGKFPRDLVVHDKCGGDHMVLIRSHSPKLKTMPRGYIIYESVGTIGYFDWVLVPYHLAATTRVLMGGKMTTVAKIRQNSQAHIESVFGNKRFSADGKLPRSCKNNAGKNIKLYWQPPEEADRKLCQTLLNTGIVEPLFEVAIENEELKPTRLALCLKVSVKKHWLWTIPHPGSPSSRSFSWSRRRRGRSSRGYSG